MNLVPTLSLSDQEHLIHKLQVFKIQGRDKSGRNLLIIVAKYFPARFVSGKALNNYLQHKIFPESENKPFAVVYVHTDVERSENYPGFSTLRSIYEAVPTNVKNHLEAVYFLHPGLYTRFFFATFGRLLFGSELYRKVKYVKRVEFLWDYVPRSGEREIQIPEFVYDYDKEEGYTGGMIDYGLESDYLRFQYSNSPYVDSPFAMYYSMRFIA